METEQQPSSAAGRMRDLAGIADYTGLPVTYLRHLVRNKAIPVTKFGGRLWFDTIEIDKWIRRNTTQPGAAA
ncbi:MAG: helix-turn-helix domain-containing protein [Acidobacteria bacterium]|nr:helix-turn-helix domain-containing protein [Acidobacteriota bacterium]